MAPVRARPLLVVAGVLLLGGRAAAQEPAANATQDQTRRAQVERLRAEMANKIHLQANDLIDELVFSWIEQPPFGTPTPVVLADVILPVGFGSGLSALVENHLAQALIKNPATNVQLAHCPACNALVVHSDAVGTVIGRGVDQPGALAKLRGTSSADHALFLDFEAEGSALVLRARMTRLEDALPIVYARTLTTRTTSAALLRSPNKLISADQAREEYVAVLEQRGPLTIPIRLAMTGFAPVEDAALQTPLPIPWLQVGVEYAVTTARAWSGSLVVGATFLPTLQTGAMVQARGYRLLSGSEVSLTWPNVYGFVGASMAIIQGQLASVLAPDAVAPNEDLFGPLATYLTVHAGLEVRVGRRIGVAVYFETMPTHYNSDNIGNYLDMLGTGIEFGILQLNSIGAEATFAF